MGGKVALRRRGRIAAIVMVVPALAAMSVVAGVANAADANRAACSNQLAAGYRAYLPDCRAYEMVSPVYKEGFIVDTESVSKDGQRLLVRSLGSFANPDNTGGLGTIYDIGRTEEKGWVPTPLVASTSVFLRGGAIAASPEMSTVLWSAVKPSQVFGNFYTASSPQGPFELVGPSGSPTAEGTATLGIAGGSRDLSHTVYTTSAPNVGERSRLWPGDGTVGVGQPSLYEYSGKDNLEPRLVGVSDEGQKTIAKSDLVSQCGTYLGAPSGNAYDAVSESGARIFFTAVGRDFEQCGAFGPEVVEPAVNELYARENGSRTIAISEPSSGDCEDCGLSIPRDAEYQGASADGSKVFFTTAQHLLTGNTSVGSDLYEYDFGGGNGNRVRLVSSGDAAGARVQAVVRVSSDGSHVYFVAQGVLTTAANSFGQKAEESAENLYVYERDNTYPAGHLAFIGLGGAGTAQTTPDGRFLVFESAADLTPDQEGQIEAGQVFEYDTQTQSLVRVSKGQDGYNNNGNSDTYRAGIPTQANSPAFAATHYTKLALSADGAYVYFTSEDALTSLATNGDTNVYEYHEGQVYLISDGHDGGRVFGTPTVELLGTSESGEDVYFTTADGLVPQDFDTQIDIYDARVDGGFPSPSEALECSDGACHPPLGVGLALSPPPTVSSAGEGALPAPAVGGVKGKPTPKPVKVKKKTKAKKKKKRTGTKKARSRKGVRKATEPSGKRKR